MSRYLFVVILSVIVFSGFVFTNRVSHDEAAVREALQHYLAGHATGDGAHHAEVFHPDSKLFWVRDGVLNSRTGEKYIAGASGNPAENESERKRWISSVDVTGDVAIGKVVLDYPGYYITDYMSLIKVDGKWQIISKIFYVDADDS